MEAQEAEGRYILYLIVDFCILSYSSSWVFQNRARNYHTALLSQAA